MSSTENGGPLRTPAGADASSVTASTAGAAVHSADGPGPDAVVVSDGYGFSGRVEYASLRSDVSDDAAVDRTATLEERQRQAAADTADVHLQLRRKQFVQPPVEFPRRAQLRTAQ